ncbi:MAG TPA: phospholipase D-like domain-containing protein [Verrucomicrobiae bacterium]|jgi:hypothetical protein
MLNVGITIWNQQLLNDFLRELEAGPQLFEQVVLISPFVNLSATSRIATRIRHLSVSLLRRRVTLEIVSDLTRARVMSFVNYQADEPHCPSFLTLYPKLHSKCGYAVARNGAHIAFAGSANLTDAALSKNKELVIAVKTTPSLPETQKVFNQIKQQADEILAESVGPGHITAKRKCY